MGVISDVLAWASVLMYWPGHLWCTGKGVISDVLAGATVQSAHTRRRNRGANVALNQTFLLLMLLLFLSFYDWRDCVSECTTTHSVLVQYSRHLAMKFYCTVLSCQVETKCTKSVTSKTLTHGSRHISLYNIICRKGVAKKLSGMNLQAEGSIVSSMISCRPTVALIKPYWLTGRKIPSYLLTGRLNSRQYATQTGSVLTHSTGSKHITPTP